MSDPCKIAVLISGSGSNLQSIINHVIQGHISASIVCVISNNPNAYGLIRAKQANIATHVIEHKDYRSREEFDRELIKTLKVYGVTLIILAGFMRILSPRFVNEYQGKILNIHPSLLPKYPGLNTHARAIEAQETEHGCSVHFVTTELDDGPLVIQATVDMNPSDSPEVLAERVLEKEHVIYPLAVKWFCEGRLYLREGNVFFNDKILKQAISLNSEYEAQLQES